MFVLTNSLALEHRQPLSGGVVVVVVTTTTTRTTRTTTRMREVGGR